MSTIRKFKRQKVFQFKEFSIKQKKALHFWREGSPHKNKKIILADGAIRAGKTISLICSFLQWTQARFESEDFIIAGKSIGALKRNVIKPMIQIMNAWGWRYYFNRSENYLIIGNHTYYLFGANNESSQDTLQGLTAAGALADEVALFPENFIVQMIGRCSVENSKIFMNCNPGNPYHFLKVDYIDKAEAKNIYYLHFTMDDNLTLSEEYKISIKNTYSGVFHKRYILGLWVVAEGIIYNMFDEDKHTISIKGIPKTFDQKFIGCDYGTGNPTVFLLFGKKGNTYYILDEYYYSGNKEGVSRTDKQYADDLESFMKRNNAERVRIYLDPSAKSFKTELKQRRVSVVSAINDVLDGIRTVASVIGENRLIIVREKCPNTMKELNVYAWDSKAQQRGEDKPIKSDDHCMDAKRYPIATIEMKPLRNTVAGMAGA